MSVDRHQPRAAVPNEPAPEFSLRKKLVFATVMVTLVLLLLEGALALFGIQPRLRSEDPFVGFNSDVPLFIEEGAGARARMVTAPNKSSFFNPQRFPKEKPAGTTRVFCLGGSTTYGRPYADATSFSGWLRELLPVVDPRRRWEVINAGGISYASYRVAKLVEELVDYDPDLFVVYTGHNEFLEERTYGELRDTPAALETMYSLAARTRTGAALTTLVTRLSSRGSSDGGRSRLANEVQAKLDNSAGPARYERDDELRDGILEHYRVSLQRMAEMARSAGAEIVFVTPASNLKDCTPFKSQLEEGLTASERARVEGLLQATRSALVAEMNTAALDSADAGLAMDPRHPELHYRRGQALLALGEFAPAQEAFTRARDEDVCPLRALTPMIETVREVAETHDLALVDFVRIVGELTRAELGHGIAGAELFLDHVHPTIEGHRQLALALIDELVEKGWIRPAPSWGEASIAGVTQRVVQSIDPAVHARALANLALTLDWAGKKEDSRRLALQALGSGVEDATISMIVARHAALEGRSDEALEHFLRGLKAKPGDPVLHSQLGMHRAGRGELEAAAAHFLLASLIWDDNASYHRQLGSTMVQRGSDEVALWSYERARRLEPAHERTQQRVSSLRARRGVDEAQLTLPEISVTRHDSGYPRTIGQTRLDAAGEPVLHGIWTSWFDGGGLESFRDYENGRQHGVEVIWNREGTELSRVRFERGVALADGQSP